MGGPTFKKQKQLPQIKKKLKDKLVYKIFLTRPNVYVKSDCPKLGWASTYPDIVRGVPQSLGIAVRARASDTGARGVLCTAILCNTVRLC